jgi:hypothetical protein
VRVPGAAIREVSRIVDCRRRYSSTTIHEVQQLFDLIYPTVAVPVVVTATATLHDVFVLQIILQTVCLSAS